MTYPRQPDEVRSCDPLGEAWSLAGRQETVLATPGDDDGAGDFVESLDLAHDAPAPGPAKPRRVGIGPHRLRGLNRIKHGGTCVYEPEHRRSLRAGPGEQTGKRPAQLGPESVCSHREPDIARLGAGPEARR